MRYKHLTNANVDVSALAVGTWAIGGDSYGAVNHDDSVAAIRKMVDCGVNLIDTAPCYGNGMSEKVVGEAIEGIRDKVILSTKFGLVTDIYCGRYGRDTSYKNVMREIQSSLMNLRTDYIDFYFIHWPDIKTPIAETMSALNWLKKEGYIRYIGVSNFSKEQIEEAQQYGQIDVQQPPFSMVNQEFVELMKWGHEKGIDSFTYGSLGAGILTGAVRELPHFDENDLRYTFYDFYKEPKFSKIMELLQVMDKIAEAHKVPVAQVAINWSTQKEFVGTALCGVRNAQEAEENCSAFNWELTAEEMALLDSEMDRLGINSMPTGEIALHKNQK
ncbi:aldo/keto reductase [Anaerolentibacter hominis]|uniref:aldo/keto reductase n=1 Tax=Anaerolentibacter hominis TaxID=3079009 RepID=UPI0031B86A1D